MIRERAAATLPGLLVMLLGLLALGFLIYALVTQAFGDSPGIMITEAILILVAGFVLLGVFVVNPNEGRVLQLFGDYVGTVKTPGLRWANPFYSKKRISLRVRNFESTKLKVNDNEGNPIEIAAVVVWRVVDTAEAVFEVDDYQNFVKVQTEAAVRNLATSYKYDAHEEDQMSLRGNTAAVADHLKKEIQDRLSKAGVEVLEARISHLAYAPEIAQAMLQRQQAGRDHRGATADRRRRGRHGRDGARACCPSARSSSSTTSARRPWSATCWWCSAASVRPSRSSTRARSISNGRG